jgi:hypothetical protein
MPAARSPKLRERANDDARNDRDSNAHGGLSKK